MRLTKNEETVLKILLRNAKTPDSAIAKSLKISSQAVGKIRKKLEKKAIKSYKIEIDYSKIGINLFALGFAKKTTEGKDLGELELEEKLLNIPEVVQFYRLPTGDFTHVILYGFKNIEDLDQFFHSKKNEKTIHKFIEIKQLFTFSNNNLIKNDPLNLFEKAIKESQNKDNKEKYKEIEKFKQRI